MAFKNIALLIPHACACIHHSIIVPYMCLPCTIRLAVLACTSRQQRSLLMLSVSLSLPSMELYAGLCEDAWLKYYTCIIPILQAIDNVNNSLAASCALVTQTTVAIRHNSMEAHHAAHCLHLACEATIEVATLTGAVQFCSEFGVQHTSSDSVCPVNCVI